MGKSKTYSYNYDEYESGKKAETMVMDILADSDFTGLDELIIGSWGGPYEEDCQPVIDAIVENADRFSHITKLFVGDMDYEECEVSWIMQGDYSRIWKAMPQLKELTIKGSMDLTLGEIEHENLESLTIICGGLGTNVIKQIEKAKLPSLKKLLLYIGVEDYGFDGDAGTIKELLANSDFPNLTYLGIVDSEIQDELAQVVLECKYIRQIETLDLSCGTLTDKGGSLLLEKLPELSNIKKLDVHHHYLSDEMMDKIGKLSPEVDVSEQEEAEEWDGEIWYNAMLTE
ncbi:MAG: STM4015 family protein [Lachnospiraceae bacterium]|nr:STM4015 family protein [Lachnospiraceae bacterium]